MSIARDVLTQEPKLLALYEAVLDDLGIDPGTRVLDVGCGPGLFLRLAALRGAIVSGIDAAAPLIEIARERLPDAELVVGDMEALPFADDAFDAVTGLVAFDCAADPARALHEAARVAAAGAPIVIATWGRLEHCEAAAWLTAMAALLPQPSPAPFALSGPGALEAFAAAGGLRAGERRDVLSVWTYPDAEAVLCALKSTDLTLQAIAIAGEERVDADVLEAVSPYRTNPGGYRLENAFSYVVARNNPKEAVMAGVESRDFESPDEQRTPDKTQVDIVRMGATTVGRFAFEPGWRWSECIKPVAGTDSCQARHVGIVQAGRITVQHDDGTELTIGPGDAYIIEPGHDAWVEGDERFVGFEFETKAAEEYAKG